MYVQFSEDAESLFTNAASEVGGRIRIMFDVKFFTLQRDCRSSNKWVFDVKIGREGIGFNFKINRLY